MHVNLRTSTRVRPGCGEGRDVRTLSEPLPLTIGQCTGRGSHGNTATSSASPRQCSHRNRSDTCQPTPGHSQSRAQRERHVLNEDQRHYKPEVLRSRSDQPVDSLGVPGAVGRLEGFGGKPLDFPPSQLLGHDGALTFLELQKSLKGEQMDRTSLWRTAGNVLIHVSGWIRRIERVQCHGPKQPVGVDGSGWRRRQTGPGGGLLSGHHDPFTGSELATENSSPQH